MKMGKAAKIVSAWIGVILVFYVILELTFLDYFTWIFPFSVFWMASPGASVLTQYTKDGVTPENYIAILGDSYAYGLGDWSIEGWGKIRPSYSAANILHDQLKRDVITFGVPAVGSTRAYNVLPDVFINYAESTRFAKIQDPKLIIAYFYEGNDLNDNVEVANKQIFPLLNDKRDIYNEEIFQTKVMPALVNSDPFIEESLNTHFQDKLFLFGLAQSILTDSHHNFYHRVWRLPKAGNTTRIEIAGQKVLLQKMIQSPALVLNQEEIDLGLYIFEQSLIALQKRFPNSKIGVAYIPATITPYHVISSDIDDYYANDKNSYTEPASLIQKNSNYICSKVREISIRRAVGFVDARARLRAVAMNNYVHGPHDWNHFNRLGYETLAKDLLVLVDQLTKASTANTAQLPECMWEVDSNNPVNNR